MNSYEWFTDYNETNQKGKVGFFKEVFKELKVATF